MAAGTKEKQTDELPTEFPADQLFVAVSEGMGEFAGHDGGPIRNGRGLWPKGFVGQWTANAPVPLALRDPNTGLIWKGYLEPVTQTAFGQNGVTICVSSEKFWVSPDETPKDVKPVKALKAASPSAKAAKRAKDGPAPIGAALKPSPTRPVSPLVASAGGRASDATVG